MPRLDPRVKDRSRWASFAAVGRGFAKGYVQGCMAGGLVGGTLSLAEGYYVWAVCYYALGVLALLVFLDGRRNRN